VYCETQKRFYVVVVKIPVSRLYKTTENELQGSRMAISNNSRIVLKVTYFEITVFPPTSTLKLKLSMFKLSNILCNLFQDNKLKFLLMPFEAFSLLIQESYDATREDMLKSQNTWRSTLK
jgi:hypothetical protein